MKAYYAVPFMKADEILECGLKLNDWADSELFVAEKRCIVAFLSPGDVEILDGTYALMKITIPNQYTYVIDNSLPPEIRQRTLVPAERYTLGQYREPRFLITCTILADGIKMYNGAIDELRLYQSSKQLYLDKLFNNADESDVDFKEIALKAYYDKMSEKGKYRKTYYEEIVTYTSNESDDIIVIEPK